MAGSRGLNSSGVSIADELREVQGDRDPLRRARRATELLAVYQQRSVELARLRRDAIEEAARTSGMTFSAVAAEVGLSKGRVTQIRQSAPPSERAFFGTGPVTVAVPLRNIGGRELGVIAAEDAAAAEAVTSQLVGLNFQVNSHQITAGGRWSFNGDAVVFCVPKTSPSTADLIATDPFLSFKPDPAGRWQLRDRHDGDALTSALDTESDQRAELAYLSRRALANGTIVLVAGIHAIGSLGAVHYLAAHLPELWSKAGDGNFSTVVRCRFSQTTIIDSQLIRSVRTWSSR